MSIFEHHMEKINLEFLHEYFQPFKPENSSAKPTSK